MKPLRAAGAFALLLSACANDRSGAQSCSPAAGRTIGTSLWYGGGRAACNMCRCDAPDESFCYAAGCPDASAVQRCQTSADCDVDHTCLFDQGCDAAAGYCVPAAQGCRPEPPPVPAFNTPPGVARFCGCDGRTYASPCPTVRYRHAGACPSP